MEWVVETGQPLELAIWSHVAEATRAQTMPTMRRPSFLLNREVLITPFWIVEATLAPAVMAPRNSMRGAMKATWVMVKTPELTEVAGGGGRGGRGGKGISCGLGGNLNRTGVTGPLATHAARTCAFISLSSTELRSSAARWVGAAAARPDKSFRPFERGFLARDMFWGLDTAG
jgi:hypothetical protein